MADSSSYGTGPFDNIVLLTDSYKTSHFKQYPPGSEFVYSYFESRGGLFKDICFFGLQYFIKRYLCGVVVTQEKIDEAEELVAAHMGSKEAFNRAGWQHILKEHGGRLPISIKSVPEGTMVPVKNVRRPPAERAPLPGGAAGGRIR
jgi:nicotinamide phosphoribosyltransferase